MKNKKLHDIMKHSNDWIDIDGEEEGLFLDTLIDNPQYYRIKPETTYRPFKDAEECWQEMQKHQPFGWIKDKIDNKFIIENINSRGYVEIYDGTYIFKDIFKDYTFIDKTPFGVKE